MNPVVIYRGARTIVDVTAAWTAERRMEYLLRRDVEAPISLDKGVSPEANEEDAASTTIELLAVVHPLRDRLAAFNDWARSAWPEPVPAPSDLDWLSLGFDVCGSFCVSSLMNCAYGDDQNTLAAAWSLLLNRYHLFDALHHATRFTLEADRLVPEHAPFLPVQLYLRVPGSPPLPTYRRSV